MTITLLHIAISLLLIVVAGVMKGKADTIAHDGMGDMWKGKYAMPLLVQHHMPWYYFGLYKPRYKERYWYSSTVLVFLTDKWHRYNWIQYRCVDVAIAVWVPGWDAVWVLVMLPVCRGVGFALSYRQ